MAGSFEVSTTLADDERFFGHDGPSAVERAGAWLRSIDLRVWLMSIGVLVVLAAVVTVRSTIASYWKAGASSWKASGQKPPTERPAGPAAPGPTAARAAVAPLQKPTGRLEVRSQPPAARVFVDGKLRGNTPLTLDDLKPGQHAVVLESAEGSVKRTVTISSSDPVVMDEMIFSGWLAVYSPFDIVVREGAKAFSLDDRHQVMLPPGPHELHLENRRLGYDEVRRIELKPGEVLTIQVAPPRSALTVRATVDAQVWVDGVLAGDTPLVTFPVALGTHEVIVKRGGDARRFVVTSTIKPIELSVDFSKPSA